MEKMQVSMEELNLSIHKRMEEFEAKLVKTSSAPASVSNLAAEFSAYRVVVTEALRMLQQQIDTLARTVDNLEMQSRRKIVLLHGVEENKEEDLANTFADIMVSRLGITNFSKGHIKRCQRLGRSSSPKKPRPILCKLKDLDMRDKIWFSKSKLRGSSITMSEFLTKTRHDVFMMARERFGVTKAWTREGSVFVMSSDGVRRRVVSQLDLSKISELQPKPSTVHKTVTTKSKRAAAVKK